VSIVSATQEAETGGSLQPSLENIKRPSQKTKKTTTKNKTTLGKALYLSKPYLKVFFFRLITCFGLSVIS
jgi:hypothetical protein